MIDTAQNTSDVVRGSRRTSSPPSPSPSQHTQPFASCGVCTTAVRNRRCRSIARPVREVLRPAPVRRRSCFEALLAPRHGRAPTTAGEVEQPATFVGSNRLATIMSLPPLRKAFGEFCRKSLCSEVCMYVPIRLSFGTYLCFFCLALLLYFVDCGSFEECEV